MEQNTKSVFASKRVWLAGLAVLVLIGGSALASSYATYRLLNDGTKIDPRAMQETVIPRAGRELRATWGNLGQQLVQSGVLDPQKLEELYANRGGLADADRRLIYGTSSERLKISLDNAGLILNLLWALGLNNKNEILERGPMSDPRYGGAGNFASTGGWTLAKGDPMGHYSHVKLVNLTKEEQALVERVAKKIYRPCCDNPTHFPDCNHGMAMLAYLELAAAQGATETELYADALILNSYWFPDNYLTIASYFKEQGKKWAKVDPALVLGAEYSSATGYSRLEQKIAPQGNGGGGSCGV